MHEKNKYRHIPWNRYNLEKYRDIHFGHTAQLYKLRNIAFIFEGDSSVRNTDLKN